MSESQKRRWQNQEARDTLAATRRGKSSGMLGKHHTSETKGKIGEASLGRRPFLGHHHSETTRMRMRLSHIGKPLSAEHLRAIDATRLRGEKHPNWHGGVTFLPYSVSWNVALRRSIRERDRYTCRVCGKLQDDVAFHVHHIDYDKTNCDFTNLVTLCCGCHSRTQYNRRYWSELLRLANTPALEVRYA